MSDRYFVDTNILIYAHDADAGAKHERARALVEELWRTRSGVVSTQILQEFVVNLRRHVVVNNGDSILEALEVEERYQISFWDALVIQAARASGAEVLYSEDLADGQFYDSVRVINPLRS